MLHPKSLFDGFFQEFILGRGHVSNVTNCLFNRKSKKARRRRKPWRRGMRAIPDSVAAGRERRVACPLWGERVAQVANAGSVAAIRSFLRFFLDFIGLYANLARVTIGQTGPDGEGTKRGKAEMGKAGFQVSAFPGDVPKLSPGAI